MQTIEYDVKQVLNKTYKTVNNKFKFTNCITLQNIGDQPIWVSDGVDFSDDNEGWLIRPIDTFKSATGIVYVKPSISRVKVTVQGTPNG